VFDLTALPSNDRRASDKLGDIVLHRETFRDWDDDWPYDDARLDLLRGPDDVFLRFLTEMIHPVVRDNDDEIDELLLLFNRHLQPDGFQMAVIDTISGKRIFATVRGLNTEPLHTQARKVADELASDHVAAQITRMQASITSDPALAIGSGKEFVESICKGILAARGLTLTGNEDLPKLVHLVREQLGITTVSGRTTRSAIHWLRLRP